jgi:hypothetical protein
MKATFSLLVFILAMVTTTGFSQEKTRREQKAERSLEKQTQIEAMVNAREFVFVPRTALPTGMKQIYLSINQFYIKFHPDNIDSYMPFYGRAYSGVGYGSDTGMTFKGTPEKFTIEKKGKTFHINLVVKGENDIYSLFLSVGFEGGASLSISTNNRSSISYQGEVSAPEKSESK